MKRFLCLILPCLLAACGTAGIIPTTVPGTMSGLEYTRTPDTSAIGLFMLTAEAGTATASYSQSDATLMAIMAAKSATATALTATLTAQPSPTPHPDVPAGAPFCHAGDLNGAWNVNAANRQILFSVQLLNASRGPCFLQAWPQVRLANRDGQPLDVDYGYLDPGLGHPGFTATQQARGATTNKVGLWPGWSVWVNLVWQNWCGKPVTDGVVIRLGFSQDPGLLKVPTNIQAGGACSAAGQRSSVGIFPLVLMPAP